MPVVFFDIGDTLGSARLSVPGRRLEALDVYPEARAALETLRAHAVRMGVISNIGDESPDRVRHVLEQAGIYPFFDPALLVYGVKDSPDIFRKAATLAGHARDPSQCLFVGESSRERAHALSAGLRVAPHPALAWEVLRGANLVYARIALPAGPDDAAWHRTIRELPAVPLCVAMDPAGGGRELLALVAADGADRLRAEGYAVTQLGAAGDPLTTELYLVRDDQPPAGAPEAAERMPSSFLQERGQAAAIVGRARDGVYVAVPADRSIEEFHFPAARHGHNEKLVPDLGLLGPFEEGVPAAFAREAPFDSTLRPEELAALAEITPDAVRRHLDRYAGTAPLGDGGPDVASRHIDHPDNARATDQLAHDLQAAGGEDVIVRLHRFEHEGRRLHNVEAELPGAEPGPVVLVAAHLDSTAAFDAEPYDPARDPAPGADDDASGVAAVLACAAAIAAVRRTSPPKAAVRFVLFNAEEHGLVGSKAYARSRAAAGDRIVAVLQMDMVGYRGNQDRPPRRFEVHAGYPPSPGVAARSLALAEVFRRLAPAVSPDLAPPQIYPAEGAGGDDPAAGRSDHASFHERGWAAVAVSEDFFAGPLSTSPNPEPNPNYHMRTDTVVDYAYAADIARLIAAAALVTASAGAGAGPMAAAELPAAAAAIG